MHSAEMIGTVYGAAQYWDFVLGGRIVTREQTRELVDYFSQEKRVLFGVALLRIKVRRMYA